MYGLRVKDVQIRDEAKLFICVNCIFLIFDPCIFASQLLSDYMLSGKDFAQTRGGMEMRSSQQRQGASYQLYTQKYNCGPKNS